MLKELSKMEGVFHMAPNIFCVLAVLAVTPAICEEIAFRGFVLSGLRHSGHKWTAIAISAVFFGAIHGILQQSLPACVLGMVLGFLAIQTGSLLPASLFHVTYNSMSLLLKLEAPRWLDELPMLGLIYKRHEGDVTYNPLFAVIGFVGAIGLLYWFRSLPFQATAEENLQEVLDHQPIAVSSGSRAGAP
jgi:sodium transport system permease protein